MNIIEAMKERRSVRNFDGRSLTPEQIDDMERAIGASTSPFGGGVTIRLKHFDLKEGYKPSTYGVIRGAESFFLIGIAGDEASALSAGFRFEQVVLKAWMAGLGTCWIAATFKGSVFNDGETWPDGEELRIICPVGTAADMNWRERLTRFAVGSKNRKPFDELFLSIDGNTPLMGDNPFHEALEMMRLAPSSTNSQPWRALVDDKAVHFYYVDKSKASVLDCGIGMCHFHLTEKYYGHEGAFDRVAIPPQAPPKWKYLTTYTRR